MCQLIIRKLSKNFIFCLYWFCYYASIHAVGFAHQTGRDEEHMLSYHSRMPQDYVYMLLVLSVQPLPKGFSS